MRGVDCICHTCSPLSEAIRELLANTEISAPTGMGYSKKTSETSWRVKKFPGKLAATLPQFLAHNQERSDQRCCRGALSVWGGNISFTESGIGIRVISAVVQRRTFPMKLPSHAWAKAYPDKPQATTGINVKNWTKYICISMTVLLNKIRLELPQYLREWLVALRFTKVNAISFTTQNLAKKIIRFIHQDLFSFPACGLAFLMLSFYINTVLYQLLHYFAPGRDCLPELHFFSPFQNIGLF